MNSYAIYLRKSRADVEAEARGEGETLARHRIALRGLAERRGLNVVKEYAELVSGDSIAGRPQMQALLDDVKRGLYDGVIVNDVDRLGRGDSIDQEIIKYTFVAGHCIIITPTRDIDPASPSDEDMLDFSMFFARFEYRKIAQRLAVGRTRSAQSGNYICSKPPYGYRRSQTNKYKLEPDGEAADTVRMIFDMYSSGQASISAIIKTLIDIGAPKPNSGKWARSSIRYILQNPVYLGHNVWGKQRTVTTIENGQRQKKQIESTPIIVENTHTPLITKEKFDRVQRMFEENMLPPSVNTSKTLVNPLAGLLYCSQCGKTMLNHGRHGKELLIKCLTPGCPTTSAYCSVIMDALIDILNKWCSTYKELKPITEPTNYANVLQLRENKIQTQIEKAQELVETGVYTPSEFLRRKETLEAQLETVRKNMKQVTTEKTIPEIMPEIKNVLDALKYAETPLEQNLLLKSIISRVEFTKMKRGANRKQSSGLIKLTVYPRLSGSVDN